LPVFFFSHECQLVNPLATPRAPLCLLPLIEVPLERIGTNLFRTLEQSACWHHCVLVSIVDYERQYPKAVFLTNMSAQNFTEVLFQMISRMVEVSGKG